MFAVNYLQDRTRVSISPLYPKYTSRLVGLFMLSFWDL
jgi:hypothetical protein